MTRLKHSLNAVLVCLSIAVMCILIAVTASGTCFVVTTGMVN